MPQTKERKAEYQRQRRVRKNEVPANEVPEVPINEVPCEPSNEVPQKRGLQPDGSFILSDGQVWYPDPQCRVVEHPSVQQMGELRHDLKERRKRIARYQAWLEAGRPSGNLMVGTTIEDLPRDLVSPQEG